jgi:hypothetical protein
MSEATALGTVLVLGAGASTDYGFPLGRGLRDMVCRNCASPHKAMLEHGFSKADFSVFGEALAHSGYTSVDWFLERHPTFIPIGKIAIATSLIPFENPERLFPPNGPERHWYEDLCNLMWADDDCSYRSGNRITVLTFNYDRSLEYYLRTVADTRAGLTAGAATLEVHGRHRIVVAQGPTIIHLHGQLGQLTGAENVRAYTQRLSPEHIGLAAASLRLLSEADEESPEFVMAREAIRQNEQLYFLGFGFHFKSVERLCKFSDDKVMASKTVSGTNVGVSASAWKHVTEDLLQGRWVDVSGRHSISHFIKENARIP